MADPISVSSINPFSDMSFGGSLGSFGSILLVIAIVVVILGLVGGLIYWKGVKKKYWIKIHVFRLIGNIPTRVAIYSAREVMFGMAGDKLWKVASKGFWKLKAVKWLPVGKIQTAPKEWWYYIRDDGEWVNFQMADLNAVSRAMNVKFVNEDMRLQRLATERLLEQRLLDKSFWERYGMMITTIIVFLVVAVCMVVIFYQFSKLMDQFKKVEQTQLETAKILYQAFGDKFLRLALNSTVGGTEGLVPIS